MCACPGGNASKGRICRLGLGLLPISWSQVVFCGNSVSRSVSDSGWVVVGCVLGGEAASARDAAIVHAVRRSTVDACSDGRVDARHARSARGIRAKADFARSSVCEAPAADGNDRSLSGSSRTLRENWRASVRGGLVRVRTEP